MLCWMVKRFRTTLRTLALRAFLRSGNNPHFTVTPWAKTMELWFALLLAQGLTTLPLPGFLCFARATLSPFFELVYN